MVRGVNSERDRIVVDGNIWLAPQRCANCD